MALTQRTHELIRSHFTKSRKKIAVDATCGNGHDTEFLCSLGFDKVFGFDIQLQAINATKQRISQQGLSATLIHSGHEYINAHLNEEVDCAMFNFGYLPSADKSITTTSSTSIQALKAVSHMLSATGLITLMCYPGHPEGSIETTEIKSWLGTLDSSWLVEEHLAKSPKPTAPILFTVSRQPLIDL